MLYITLKSCQQALEYYWNDSPATSFEINLNGFYVTCELIDFSSTEATYSYDAFIKDWKLTGYFKVNHTTDDK
ncbi:MAG: hypothetical protein J7K69_00145 [Thermotogae bacterium]|nr:hypothetical protein [Thermotogota bacterium]